MLKHTGKLAYANDNKSQLYTLAIEVTSPFSHYKNVEIYHTGKLAYLQITINQAIRTKQKVINHAA